MKIIKFYRKFCQRLRDRGEKTPSFPEFLLALRANELAIYIDKNRGLCIAPTFSNPWVNRTITQNDRDFFGRGNPDIDFLYVYLLQFLTLTINEIVAATSFKQYAIVNLYTGPPGIKQLFSISIPLRRVLFASDIL